MAINDDLHRYKDVLKKQISHAFRIYLSIAIILSPLYLMNSANAASLGGWSIGGSTVQGASVLLNGTKELILNGAKKIATGSATITPTASQVAKTFGKTAGALALTVAIEQMLGAVDWVLDLENNQIKYTQKLSTTCKSDGSDCTSSQYLYLNDKNQYQPTSTFNPSCDQQAKNIYGSAVTNTSIVIQPNGVIMCTALIYGTYSNITSLRPFQNPAYNPDATNNEPKTLPLSTVAQKVIDQAASGRPEAQQVIRAAADTIVAEAETDSTKARPIVSQFEQTSTIETTEKSTSKSESTTTTNTANPEESTTKTDTATEFPVFCGWAPTICQAANVVIQKPQEWAENIKAAYDDAVDYFKEEPTNKDSEELEIEQPEFEAEQVNLQGSTQCPQDSVSFSLMGKSYTLDMPYQPVCNALDFFRPAVLAVGAITSAYIIAGIRTKEDET